MGGGASSIPQHIDKETFRQLSGGTVNDAIFDANSVAGIMTRDKLIELSNVRDCFISHEWGNDIYGRNIEQRVSRINQWLRGKGLITHFDENRAEKELVNRICSGIDNSKSVVCFITKGYINKVGSGSTTSEKCNMEFNYTLRRKHPSLMIPIILEEEVRDQSTWTGPVEMALGVSEYIDFSTDDDFETKCETLYNRITKISRKELVFNPELLRNNSVLSQMNKSKEEQQFFQWMSRSTNIDESRRLIYCASLVKIGVTNVFVLANMMKNVPKFLTSVGMNEYDADQIALAIRDLGLGFIPIKDFDDSLTLESVIFALTKSKSSKEDPLMAESALTCVARVGRSNKIMPTLLNDANVTEAILTLMKRNLQHAPTIKYGCLCIHIMSDGSQDITEKFGYLAACDVIPTAVKCHMDNADVVQHGCQAIATLSIFKANRVRFNSSGACEVVMRGLIRHVQDAGVAQFACRAATHLAMGYIDNMGKLVMAGGCLATAQVLNLHSQNEPVVIEALRIINIIAADPNCRTQYGLETPCCSALFMSLQSLQDSKEAVRYSCETMATLCAGNMHNRTVFGQCGACLLVRDLMIRYASDVSLASSICRAIFHLASGDHNHKMQFNGVQQYILKIINDNSVPEELKKEPREAIRYV